MDQFNEIGLFAKTVELCSISKTAVALQTSNATVSRVISKLEANLGVKLFQRTTRRISPTSDGLAFYERCKPILNQLEDAKSEMTALRDTPRGTLRVVVPIIYGKLWIMSMLNSFAKRYPDVTINVTLSDQFDYSIEDNFDVALWVGEVGQARLVARKLRLSRTVTVAAPGYLAKHGTPNVPQDLAEHNCLLYGTFGGCPQRMWEFVDANQIHHTVAVRGNTVIDNGHALTEAAAQGVGIIQAPDFAVLPQLREGRLAEVLVDYRSPGAPVWMLYSPNRHRTNRVQMLIDEILVAAHNLSEAEESIGS
ncbi:MAG TPA: LysR family transcriptional regulator [Bordetella sp.]|nr:LysR family transcriptional regulator [Bordetella sp.]